MNPLSRKLRELRAVEEKPNVTDISAEMLTDIQAFCFECTEKDGPDCKDCYLYSWRIYEK